MQFRVLRPRLEVVTDGGELVPIRQALYRGTISIFLLFEGQPLSRIELMEFIWARPVTGGRMRTCLYEVRRVIGKHRLVWHGGVYQLNLNDADWCDLTEFRNTAREAEQALRRQELRIAAEHFDRALQLWDDQPFQDVPDTPAAIEAATAVTEEMRQARETLVAIRMDLGQASDLIGPLTAITDAEPLNEEAWGQLMIALYRCGRQAEALHAYHQARRALEDANLEPDDHLRHLRRQIQARDPALDQPAATAPARHARGRVKR